MAEVLDRTGAEIIAVTRSEGTDLIVARVKLYFRLADQAGHRAGEIVTSVHMMEKDDFYWKGTKHRIVERAWDWLDDYFDGMRVGIDSHNLFEDVFSVDTVPNEYGLTPEQERSLERELRNIERECAA